MDIAYDQLPVPDWGLTCPQCSYPLKGLPAHRCPECGSEFDVESMVQPWTRVRDPRFTGAERPLPNFDLDCASCGAALAGAEADTCPACAAPFELTAILPERPWFIVDADLAGSLPIPGVQALFGAEHVPYVPIKERSVSEIYGGHAMTFSRLRVPTEFYFEVLWLLARARADFAAARAAAEGPEWTCVECGEGNPGNFELCWNCETPRRST